MSVHKLFAHVAQALPKRTYASAASAHIKVTLCGAANQVGQPLSLLLKQSPYIDELALYDTQDVNSLAMELGHVDTKCSVDSYAPNNAMEAFQNSNIVLIVSGLHAVGNKGLDRIFPKNAVIIQQLVSNVAKYCPKALVAIGTHPVEGLVPIATEKLKLAGVYNPNHVFGVTTLNVVRANTFAANILGLEPECVLVPVIGGTTEGSIVPVLSQALPCSEFTELEIENITKSLQSAQYCVENLKSNDGPTLASAFAMARFVVSLIKGIMGQSNIVEYSFIRTNDVPAVKYFGVPTFLGPDGVLKDLGLPTLSNYEQCLVEEAVPVVKCWIEKGNEFVGKLDPLICDPCTPDSKKDCPIDQCDTKKQKAKF